MTATLMQMRAERLRLESDLEHLRDQLGIVDDELAELRAIAKRGSVRETEMRQREDAMLEVRREIQRRKIALAEIDDLIFAAEAEDRQNLLRQLALRNEQIKDELDLQRRELLKALLGLADLLRWHQRTASEKLRISGDLSKLDGKNYAYENYIACALLHKQDYDGDAQFVVDTLKKIRPVT